MTASVMPRNTCVVDEAGSSDPKKRSQDPRRTGLAAGANPPHGDEGVDRWGEMMIAARDGNDAAYDLLLREVAGWLQRYFRRRLSPSAADDAVQDALLAIHLRRYTYEARGPFGPWLAAIARYKWMDRLRVQYRDADMVVDEEILVGDHGDAVCSTIAINRLIDRLKPAQATVIRLVKLHGASIEEASSATGQSTSLVKVNIHRGLKQIAAYVDASGENMPA